MALMVNSRNISPWIEYALGTTPKGTYISEDFADVHQLVYNSKEFEKSLQKLDINEKYKYPGRPSGTKLPFEDAEEEEEEKGEKKKKKKKNKQKV